VSALHLDQHVALAGNPDISEIFFSCERYGVTEDLYAMRVS